MRQSFTVASLASAYVRAKQCVIHAGFGSEILWQSSLQLSDLTESKLLREYAWVTLSAGMREAVIRQIFPAVTNAFLGWVSCERIVARRDACVAAALVTFRHSRKIGAIAEAAEIILVKGFPRLFSEIEAEPMVALDQFPYIGPATYRHLAKNIGLPVAKPDRHLSRLAALTGYATPLELCGDIAEYVGDSVPVVDVVLWRFATLHREYQAFFAGSSSSTTAAPSAQLRFTEMSSDLSSEGIDAKEE